MDRQDNPYASVKPKWQGAEWLFRFGVGLQCSTMIEHMDASAAMEALAARLAEECDSILARWRCDMAASGEAAMVKTLTRTEFYDQIPEFLEQFCAMLSGDSHALRGPSRQHGAHRWQQGLDFEEVVLEWNALHRILFEWINVLGESTSLDPDSLRHTCWLLADTIQKAIASSLSEFYAHQRLEAEARMLDLEAVLERRGQGLHQASHDLRGSLQAIQLYCNTLRRRQLDQQTDTIVGRLSHAVDGLSQLFSDMLELARLEAGRDECRISEFDAAILLRELCETMQSTAAAKGLSLQVRGVATLPVRSDPAKLRRIAQNLVLNALSYTPAGLVEVVWQAESATHWSFHVRDTGPGVSDSTAWSLAMGLENAENADEPITADDAVSVSRRAEVHGEGVGLAIVRQLCVLLNAVLEVDTESGCGTTFRIQLPR